MGWKLPSHNSGSVEALESYGNWMLMTSSSIQGELEVGYSIGTC